MLLPINKFMSMTLSWIKPLSWYVILTIILVTALLSCTKEEEKNEGNSNIKFQDVVPGGCALGFNTYKQFAYTEPDTVIYKIISDSLSIYVGFNTSCGPDYATSTKILNDTIYMYLNRKEGPFASCLCYFTYTFNYTGIDHSYYYEVNIDNWKFFNGFIEY